LGRDAQLHTCTLELAFSGHCSSLLHFIVLLFLPSGIDTAFLVWEHVDTPLGLENLGVLPSTTGRESELVDVDKASFARLVSLDSPKELTLELDIERLYACL
jgi:hypothetical protein